MTFDGSADLHADADLIVGGMLVDFKANQGSKPRADGTRAASLARTDIDQLLGYTLMDYFNAYGLHSIAIYAVRFGYLATWPYRDDGRPPGLTLAARHPVPRTSGEGWRGAYSST